MAVVSDPTKLEEGEIYSDNIFGCLRKVRGKTDRGAVLQNLPTNGMAGIRMTVEPDSTRLSFYPV